MLISDSAAVSACEPIIAVRRRTFHAPFQKREPARPIETIINRKVGDWWLTVCFLWTAIYMEVVLSRWKAQRAPALASMS